MKTFFYAALLAVLSAPVFAQDVGVGVNVTIGQPGFYGQIILGNAPPPQVIYPQPVVIAPGPVVQAPIYLRVPPGYEKHWRRHCREYNACGRPVYFVRDRWYHDVYVPHYRRYENEYRSHRGEWRGRGDERGYGRGRDDEGRGRDHRRGDRDRDR